MNKSLLLLSILVSHLIVFSQSFNSPESVDFDVVRGRWIVGQNGSGEIHVYNPQANTLSNLASGLSSGPYGIECAGDIVYACDGGWVRGYNLITGASVFNLNLMATFLNGITWDGNNTLFTTDFSAKKIYKINISASTYTTMATTTYSPNGIYYDGANNRCVFVNWGSTARIQAIDITTNAISTLYTTTTSNIDGITRDLNGNWYITTWGGSALRKFDPNFSAAPVTVLSGLSSPADIDINAAGDSIGIPNSGSLNNVVFYSIPVEVVASISASDSSICSGNSVLFSGNATGSPTSWNWSFPGGTPSTSMVQNPTIIYSSAGGHDVTLIAGNSGGSYDTIALNSFIMVNPLPAAPSISQINDSTLSTNVTFGINWNINGTPLKGGDTQQLITDWAGDYTVTFTDVNGCSATSEVLSFTPVGISEISTIGLSVSPNPTSDIFTIRLENPAFNSTIYLIDYTGRIVLQSKLNGNNIQLQKGKLNAGLYRILVKDEKGKTFGTSIVIK